MVLLGSGEGEVSPGGVRGYPLSLVPSSLSAPGYQEVRSSALPCPLCHHILHYHRLKSNGPEDEASETVSPNPFFPSFHLIFLPNIVAWRWKINYLTIVMG